MIPVETPPWMPNEWNAVRIDVVRKVAENGGTAREAAEAAGLAPEQDHTIYKLAKREGFKFQNTGRKRSDNFVALRLPDKASDALTAEARRLDKPRRDLAAALLVSVLDQGGSLIDNLLADDR